MGELAVKSFGSFAVYTLTKYHVLPSFDPQWAQLLNIERKKIEVSGIQFYKIHIYFIAFLVNRAKICADHI